VYKDVKPRVDTRWKKTENSVAVKPLGRSTSNASSITTNIFQRQQQLQQQAAAVGGQLKKSNENVAMKKEKTLKSLTDAITMQIKKTTTLTSTIEIKREKIKSKETPISTVQDIPFIRSPQSMKVKRVAEVGRKFFESHSTHLLHMIENIDEKDENNPQLLSEYVNDIYAYLMSLEEIYPIRSNFLESQMDVTPKMRSVLLDWMNEVHFQFNLEIETYHMAVSMLDRYLQTVSSTTRRHLQLVGVTALFMASKVIKINNFI
jgi:cyclin B